MAYIRWDKDNDLCVYMSFDGLVISLPIGVSELKIKPGDVVGREQAIAIFEAIQDHLISDGYAFKMNNKDDKVKLVRRKK